MICDYTKSTEEQLKSNDRLKHHYELGKKREAFWNRRYRNIQPAEFEKINWEENLEGKGFLLNKGEPLGKTRYSDTYQCKIKPGSIAVNIVDQCLKDIQESEFGLPIGSKDQIRKIEILACKVIRIKSLSKALFSLYSKRNFSIWISLKFVNLVNYHKIFATNSLDKYYIFMDLGEQGTLTKYLKSTTSDSGLPVDKATNLAIDILNGLHYLHSNAISHRRLKADNIFITQNGTQAKIGGFEYFLEFCDIDHNGEKSLCWMHHEHNGFSSIEAIANETHDPFLEDIFGFGALFYYLLADHTPFDSCKQYKESSHHCKEHRSSFKRNITNQTWTKRESYKQKDNEQIKNLLASTFSLNPLNRPSTEELLIVEMFKCKK